MVPKSMGVVDESKIKKYIESDEFQHINVGYVVIIPIQANPNKVNVGRTVAGLFMDNKKFWSLSVTNELKLWKFSKLAILQELWMKSCSN